MISFLRICTQPFIVFILIIALSCLISNVNCDLPIHCLKHQVIGQWKFTLSKGSSNINHQQKCGHSSPDKVLSKHSTSHFKRESKETLVVDLLESGEAVLLESEFNLVGTWNMMYDEGIILKIGSHDLFVFFLFYDSPPEETGQGSETRFFFDCTSTSKGWYNDSSKNIKGCVFGENLNPIEDNQRLKCPEKEMSLHLEDDINNFQFQENESNQLFTQQKQQKQRLRNKLSSSLSNIIKSIDFNVPSNKSSFHDENVNKLNSLDKQWTAGLSDPLKSLSMSDLNKMSGGQNRKRHHHQRGETDKYYQHYSRVNVSDLPVGLSWEEYIDEPVSQEDCGSCYVISTVSMLNARLKIKYGKMFDKKVSKQHILDCSFYSQGCAGGYPYEVNRFGSDYFLVSEDFLPFQTIQQECTNPKLKDLKEYFKITSYGFIGSGFGKTTEREMMLEILSNGPIVANIKTQPDLLYYQKGVYHSVKAADWILQKTSEPEWRPIEHAVLCYGWGESKSEGKYWLMQNSWGTNWGDHGRFKLRRGTDESFVESSPEFALIDYIEI